VASQPSEQQPYGEPSHPIAFVEVTAVQVVDNQWNEGNGHEYSFYTTSVAESTGNTTTTNSNNINMCYLNNTLVSNPFQAETNNGHHHAPVVDWTIVVRILLDYRLDVIRSRATMLTPWSLSIFPSSLSLFCPFLSSPLFRSLFLPASLGSPYDAAAAASACR
jgi:hypothetical protein